MCCSSRRCCRQKSKQVDPQVIFSSQTSKQAGAFS